MGWCDPELEFEKEFYHPGEEVIGCAKISTKKDMTARNVTITFTGKTVTAWKSGEKDNDVRRKGFSERKAEEVHVKMSHEVWKAQNEENIFPAGDYQWNFSFQLPVDCPASFEGYYGFIRYAVKINVDVPNWPDTCVKKAISVSPIINLNLIPGAADPTRVQLENPVRSCCAPLNFMDRYKKGNVAFTLSCPTLGYVSGDTVTVTGMAENHSTRTIDILSGSLHRMVIYRVDLEKNTGELFKRVKGPQDDMYNSTRHIVTLESKREFCQVTPGFIKEFSFSFEIPPVVATIRNAKFISLEYFVRITADTEGKLCSDAKADMNIIVGNVPLGDEVPAQKLWKGDAAVRWRDDLDKEFAPLFPYFGSKEGYISEDKDVITIDKNRTN